MMLDNNYMADYIASLSTSLEAAFGQLQKQEWTVENFRYFTAVSVMASSKIEGEQLEIDSYLKHKTQHIDYLPNLTEKPNDLYEAYEFARDNPLTRENFDRAHAIATRHLLPQHSRGKVRTSNMIIMEQHTGRVQYEAAPYQVVQTAYAQLWKELETLLSGKYSIEAIFYYASFAHLVFAKIHPFNDGNGRSARLLEKWFLSALLGERAWYVASEYYYYNNLAIYYNNLARIGLFYDSLDYSKALSFLLLLPQSLHRPK